MSLPSKKRASQNRTLTLTDEEVLNYNSKYLKLNSKIDEKEIVNRIINQSIFNVLDFLPDKFVDLLFIDPPYNLNKKFSTLNFKEMKEHEYEKWIDSWLSKLIRILKPTASIYFCCDWKTSISAYNVLKKYFHNS